jgi:glyceraldehyde 3-phosphate dehydrogenase
LFDVLAAMALAGSLAILGVLGVCVQARHWFGAQIAYAIWILVPIAVVAMVLPAPLRPLEAVVRVVVHAVASLAGPVSAPIQAPMDWRPALLLGWLAGALTMVARFALHTLHRGDKILGKPVIVVQPGQSTDPIVRDPSGWKRRSRCMRPGGNRRWLIAAALRARRLWRIESAFIGSIAMAPCAQCTGPVQFTACTFPSTSKEQFMAVKIAINGYGRIGRNVLRALYEAKRTNDIQIVAVNDLADAETNAHLTQYDTAHGKYPGVVGCDSGDIIVDGDRIKVCAERDPAKLPWASLGVDIVLECTGFFTSKAKASAHIAAGAKKVIISAPGDKDMDGTFVYGVNHQQIKGSDQVISNASCTTNCLAPLAMVLHEKIGIVHGLMTTIHAYTNDQVLTDVYHKDLRRARSATMSQIPTKTGAAAAIGLVLPALKGKLDGFSMRIPTINVSCVDLSFVAQRATSAEEIDAAVREASEGKLKNILGINHQPLVSVDFNNDPRSSVYDATQTRVMGGTLVKVLAWYDNEWGFSNRMLDMTLAFANAK